MDGAAEWSHALGQIDWRLGSCDRSTSSDNGVMWTGEILRYTLFISLTYAAHIPVVQPM